MSCDDRIRWEKRYAGREVQGASPPSPFLQQYAEDLPIGWTMEIACGRGGNAALLASLGHRVVAADVARGALRGLREIDGVRPVQMDLDTPGFAAHCFDAVVCTSFLDRRLFPWFPVWLRPGGWLLIDTFLADQASLGHPRNPAFLLERGELGASLPAFRIVHLREGLVEREGPPSYRAGIVAIAPG